MTIHSEHPFLPPDDERDPVRRLRGRVGGTVSLWTTGAGRERVGLTVSSYLVAPGQPGRILALVDPDSDLVTMIATTRTAVVQPLEWQHRDLGDAFAGVAPAPGGAFRMGVWQDTDWGPRLTEANGWAGVRLVEAPREMGWSVLVETVVEHAEIGADVEPLVHRRGRYLRPR